MSETVLIIHTYSSGDTEEVKPAVPYLISYGPHHDPIVTYHFEPAKAWVWEKVEILPGYHIWVFNFSNQKKNYFHRSFAYVDFVTYMVTDPMPFFRHLGLALLWALLAMLVAVLL